VSAQPAFNGQNVATLCRSIAEDQPAPVMPHFSAYLSQLVMSMLSKRPEARPGITEILSHPMFAHYSTLTRRDGLQQRSCGLHLNFLSHVVSGISTVTDNLCLADGLVLEDDGPLLDVPEHEDEALLLDLGLGLGTGTGTTGDLPMLPDLFAWDEGSGITGLGDFFLDSLASVPVSVSMSMSFADAPLRPPSPVGDLYSSRPYALAPPPPLVIPSPSQKRTLSRDEQAGGDDDDDRRFSPIIPMATYVPMVSREPMGMAPTGAGSLAAIQSASSSDTLQEAGSVVTAVVQGDKRSKVLTPPARLSHGHSAPDFHARQNRRLPPSGLMYDDSLDSDEEPSIPPGLDWQHALSDGELYEVARVKPPVEGRVGRGAWQRRGRGGKHRIPSAGAHGKRGSGLSQASVLSMEGRGRLGVEPSIVF
jgi:hypothetical protein